MKNSIKFLIPVFTLTVIVAPFLAQAETTKSAIEITASSVSSDGLYAITVYISNSNPKSLKLKAEYGEGEFDLESNTFSFNDSGRGVADLSAGLRPGQTYIYRLFDTTGVLNPSETYSFTTSGGGGSGGSYQSYRIYNTSSGSTYTPGSTYSTSNTPLPTTPPNTNTSNTDTSNSTTTNTAPTTTSAPITLGTTPSSSTTTSTSTSGSTSIPEVSNTGLVPCNNTPAVDGTIAQPCDFNAFMNLINIVIKFILFSLVLPIAAIMFFYAGLKMVTSGGSAEARGKAKSIFTNAVLGLAIAVGAWLIIRTILSILGYQGAWIGF
ncbi:hypothetical protein A2917_01920 [Candidatus Nomurabacteria bacterium RIFCSPLOWO2_01_FULL_42_17]|uniref:Purple acid phosphatase N-terminal domain-containing protein n=1 Tax=Candidatus Nomurabacteria bacterium RIFCSPLOWO2_01_FULL_42_17 TaxID=1801780 RepID=A0A1F6XLQ5_9BACT|nr:MAG: hypothetical protein A2917_01920 [Candidatus Nomurabacteria bacterium RIFCSPLOWO2_01_FULL_42_17]